MEILLRNETVISKEKIEKTEKYAQTYKHYIEKFINLGICIFIIVSALLTMKIYFIDKMLYIIFAILGIKNTLFSSNLKARKEKLIYDFYEEYIEVKNSEYIIQIEYDVITKFIEDENNYYMIFKECGMFIDKNRFSIGTDEDMRQLIKRKLGKLDLERG